MTDGLNYASYSSLTTHRVCPMKWYYGHIRKLIRDDSEDIAVERDFGSWWQMLRAADSIKRGLEYGTLQWVPEVLTSTDEGPTLPAREATPAAVLVEAERWWNGHSSSVQEIWVERLGEDLPRRLSALDARWRARWAESLIHERPLAVELAWDRELPALQQPLGQSTHSRTVLVGYIDEIYFDVKRRLIVVRDNKGHKKLRAQSAALDMMDSQLQLYAWGAAPIVQAWGQGGIRATAYDRVRITRPTTPVVTQSGSLSKTVSDYDLSTYLEWCQSEPTYPGRKKDGSQAGIYRQESSVVEKLSTPAAQSAWFQRTLIPLNVNIVTAHLRTAVDSALDMQISYERAKTRSGASRNLAAKNCDFCDFSGLCRTEMYGGPVDDQMLSEFKLKTKSRSKR